MIIILNVSNSLDSSTVIDSSNAQLQAVPNSVDTFEIVDLGGNIFADAGAISWDFLYSAGQAAFTAAYLSAVSHNGGGGASFFGARIAGPGLVTLGPPLFGDPSVTNRNSVGPLAMASRDEYLLLTSNGAGAQQIVIELIPCRPQLIPTVTDRIATSSATSAPVIVSMFLADLESANAAEYFLEWAGPTSQLNIAAAISNAAVAGANLELALFRNGIAIPASTITVPVGASGTSGTVTLTTGNIFEAGDSLSVSVAGNNTTVGGNGSLTLSFTPVG